MFFSGQAHGEVLTVSLYDRAVPQYMSYTGWPKNTDGLLSFELNEATEDEYLVSYGNSFQDLIEDGKKLLQYDVVLKIGILDVIIIWLVFRKVIIIWLVLKL